MADCWSCGAERGESIFCGTCGLIQPVAPHLDYFAALGLERHMRLERAALDRAFREASKKVHPDRFPREEAAQRKLALAHTELVNQAYRTLKDPRSRGEYLLSLAGAEVAAETERTEDPAFLMEMLEKQEAVESARDADTVDGLKIEARARYEALLDRVARYFDEGEGSLEGARAALVELRFVRRMLDQIALVEQELI